MRAHPALHLFGYKKNHHHMKSYILIWALSLSAIFSIDAQPLPMEREPDGGNKKAWIGEQIGIVKISISYNRPGVKGREGKIWGTPVAHYGLVDLGHGTSYAAPWRAGANENTTFTFSHPVKIEGHDLAAGTYGFFIINGETESTLIFSNNSSSWGSFYYEPSADALRVKVKNQSLSSNVEWLKYEFLDQTDTSATVALSWEKRMIPFRITAETKKLQVEAFRKYFQSTRETNDFIEAADYCLKNNYELEQALAWIDRGLYFRIMGQKTFRGLSTKAAILTKLNRAEEAAKIMDEALPLGSVTDIHFYGRTLLAAKKYQEAFKVFKANYDKNPNMYTTNVGLGRAYSALGDFKHALIYMNAALPLAPDNLNKNSVAAMIKNLEASKDIN
jgi:tetratricopeptide (TPR) repeat protein